MVVDALKTEAFDSDSGTTAAAKRPSVLVVDDDAGLLGLIRLILCDDYVVKTARNGSDALDAAAADRFDAIVLDMRMPVLDGPGFYRQLRARGDTTPVLVTSSFGAFDAQRELGAEAAIEKPFEPDSLLQAVYSLTH